MGYNNIRISDYRKGLAMIQWDESYSTGVPKLDKQHQSLFQYANDLEAGVKRGDISKNTLELALKFLERYARSHFGQEEDCMNRYACPVAGANREAHQDFIRTYTVYQARLAQGQEPHSILTELHAFIENWLHDHICKIDTQMKGCVPPEN